MCGFANETLRSRTAYQLDLGTVSAVGAERKYIFSASNSIYSHPYFSNLAIHYVGTPASLFSSVYQRPYILNYLLDMSSQKRQKRIHNSAA